MLKNINGADSALKIMIMDYIVEHATEQNNNHDIILLRELE